MSTVPDYTWPTFSTADEAKAQIRADIEEGNEAIADGYDIDAILAETYESGPIGIRTHPRGERAYGYRQNVTPEEFWDSVRRNEKGPVE